MAEQFFGEEEIDKIYHIQDEGKNPSETGEASDDFSKLVDESNKQGETSSTELPGSPEIAICLEESIDLSCCASTSPFTPLFVKRTHEHIFNGDSTSDEESSFDSFDSDYRLDTGDERSCLDDLPENCLDAKDDLRTDLQNLLQDREERMVALTKEINKTAVSKMVDDSIQGGMFGVEDVGVGEKKVFQGEEPMQLQEKQEICEESEPCLTEDTKKSFEDKENIPTESQDEIKEPQAPAVKKVEKENEEKFQSEAPAKENVEKAELLITRKSLRTRKPPSKNGNSEAKKISPSSAESFFRELKVKIGKFEGHHHDVSAVDVYENFAVSGSRDTSVKLWLVSSQEELKSLGGHDGTVTAVRFLQDRPFEDYPDIVTGSYDCSLRLWDLHTGQTKKSIYVYSPVICLDYTDGVAAIGTEAGKMELYNVETGANLYTVNAFESSLSAIKMLPNKRVVVGSSEGLLKIYNTEKQDDKSPEYTLDLTSLKVKQLNETGDEMAASKCTNLVASSKINCITCYDDLIVYGDDGYNIKMLDMKKGELLKARNNLKEYSPTECLHIATVDGTPCLFSVGADVDNGDAHINVRSLPDLHYLGTIHDVSNNSGPITCLVVTTFESRLRMITGGQQMRVWDQVRMRMSTRKRKGSDEESVVPCKYVCSYTEPRDSEPDSSSEDEIESTDQSSSSAVKETTPTPQTWCTLL